MDRKTELAESIDLCEKKLLRAEKLIGGLGGERERWAATARALGEQLPRITGDILIASGAVAYLGPFTTAFRSQCLGDWGARSAALEIPCTQPFSLIEALGDSVAIRQWQLDGLPVDNLSTENAIIMRCSRRWPLMIDPQGQASKWVKHMEKGNKLVLARLGDSDFARVLENAVRFGMPLLVESVGEELDPMLDSVLLRSVFRQGGIDYIRIGENTVEYSADFRLYLASRLRNPHYLPEVAVRVSLLNFMITTQGLNDQLLGIVAAREKPELEKTKNELVVASAENKRQLKEIEDQILEVLSSSSGNILDDSTAVEVLSSSKALSDEIAEKEVVAERTGREIDETRNGYVPVSGLAATVFFCIADMGAIDSMYQYSLEWFTRLYEQSIVQSKKSPEVAERVELLNAHFLLSIFNNVCRSLFEKDKLLFSLLLTVAIEKNAGRIADEEWRFLVTGGVALENSVPNPAAAWLGARQWDEMVRMEALPTGAFAGFLDDFELFEVMWRKIHDSPTPHLEEVPRPWDTKLDAFQRLAVMRCLRPDKMVPQVRRYVAKTRGEAFTQPPAFDLPGSYADSDCCTPLIFVLSPGSDPVVGLQRFARQRGFDGERLKSISLGQGQGPIADRLIRAAMKQGTWVLLQNCHLCTSWLPELAKLTEEVIVPEDTHPDFRLWLTSYPSPQFPASILQNGVKMTNEPPQGLRANMLQAFGGELLSDPEFFSLPPPAATAGDKATSEEEVRPVGAQEMLERALYGLCMFHAVVQERRSFGALGWNIPYGFNASDLRISAQQIRTYVAYAGELPLDAVQYLIGECNYGGRVTDDWDRRCMAALLQRFVSAESTGVRGHMFSPDGVYRSMALEGAAGHGAYIEHIEALPVESAPDVFGLHSNAILTKNQKATAELFAGVVSTLPRQTVASGASGAGEEDGAQAIASSILARLPAAFDAGAVANRHPISYDDSMNTVLQQECTRFNRLTRVVRSSLNNLGRASKGLVLMSPELEEVSESLSLGRIPALWAGSSYPSLKPLGGYVADLLSRLAFLQSWVDGGAPAVFWISGFFFTQAFLTAALQNYARKTRIPVDHLTFSFEVLSIEAADVALVQRAPASGVFVHGLFLEGASWDRAAQVLAEAEPKVLYDTMPIIHFDPVKRAGGDTARPVFRAPVYKTGERRGTLSTTGHSTNFVTVVELPSTQPDAHWVARGVALLTQLSDR